jgi:hypothetical protein
VDAGFQDAASPGRGKSALASVFLPCFRFHLIE